jgi:hypothetical protein
MPRIQQFLRPHSSRSRDQIDLDLESRADTPERPNRQVPQVPVFQTRDGRLRTPGPSGQIDLTKAAPPPLSAHVRTEARILHAPSMESTAWLRLMRRSSEGRPRPPKPDSFAGSPARADRQSEGQPQAVPVQPKSKVPLKVALASTVLKSSPIFWTLNWKLPANL